MKKIKIVSLLIAVVMMLGSFSIQVFAAGTVMVPNIDLKETTGVKGFSVSNTVDVDLNSVPSIALCIDGSNPSSAAYKISTPEELIAFSDYVNNKHTMFQKTIYLNNDIDMTGKTMNPIGNAKVKINTVLEADCFRGVFDGQGHAIKNLNMSSSEDGDVNVALFGAIRGACIRNLIIDSSCSFSYNGNSETAKTASLVAYAFAHGGDSGKDYSLGQTGANYGSRFVPWLIDNVQNNASVTANAGYAGGLIATAAAGTIYPAFIMRSTNNGEVKGTIAGGILGAMTGMDASRPLTIIKCTVAKPVTGKLTHNIANDILGIVNIRSCIYPKDGYGTGYSYGRIYKVDTDSLLSVKELTDGTVTNKKAYKISTADELIAFSEYVNKGNRMSGIYVCLANDIDMTGKTMNPIGFSATGSFSNKNAVPGFYGTFDGQGHVIDNWKFISDAGKAGETAAIGLFGVIFSAVIKNVVIGSGCEIRYEGAATGYVSGVVGMSFRIGDSHTVYPTIENCYSAAKITSNYSAAGIVGMVEGNNNNYKTVVRDCTNTGEIQGKELAAGIVGKVFNRAIEILYCRNAGTVNANSAGSICANPGTFNSLIDYCVNNGTGSFTDYVGSKFPSTQIYHSNDYSGQQDPEWDMISYVGSQSQTALDHYNVRFLAKLNTLELQSVGFEITASYGEHTSAPKLFDTKTVYTGIKSNVNGVNVAVNSESFGGKYLIALTVTNVPNDIGEVTFTVRAYQTVNGERSYQDPITVVYHAGEYVEVTK